MCSMCIDVCVDMHARRQLNRHAHRHAHGHVCVDMYIDMCIGMHAHRHVCRPACRGREGETRAEGEEGGLYIVIALVTTGQCWHDRSQAFSKERLITSF